MSNPSMNDRQRFGMIDAALNLCDVISETVGGEEDWEAIPDQDRLEIVTTMEKLVEAASVGNRHLQESVETREQEEEVKQRREQIRELNRKSA